MWQLQLSGGYRIEGKIKLPKSNEEVDCRGLFLLLQLDDKLVGRGEIIPMNSTPEHFLDRGYSPSGGVLLDLSAFFESPTSELRIRLRGGMITLDWHTFQKRTANEISGEVNLVEKIIYLRLGCDPILGDVILHRSFPFGDISRDELWSRLFKSHLFRIQPWTLISSHEKLQAPLLRYLSQSTFETNVFIMMRFVQNDQNQLIRSTIESQLQNHGLVSQFADNISFTDDLWDNVCTYMIGSRFGVAVIEEIEERTFNPNVAIEIGFMRAIQRRVLVLKDKRVPKLPADLIGQIYKEFDSYNLVATISAQIDAWIQELDVLGEFPKKGSKIHLTKADSILCTDSFWI